MNNEHAKTKKENPFNKVPTPVLLDLLEQACSSGGTLAPALKERLDELDAEEGVYGTTINA